MKKLFLLIIFLLILILGVLFYKNNLSNKNLYFKWMPGYKASYFFTNKTISFFGNNKTNKYTLDIDGILNFKILNTKNSILSVLQLTNLKVLSNGLQDDLLEKLYANPIIIEFNKDGSINSMKFINNIPDEDKEMLKQLYYSIEIVLPENKKTEYIAKQNDQMGSYIAKYKRSNNQGIKEKLQYIKTSNSIIKNNIEITHSSFSFKLNKNNSWLLSLKGEEKIKFKMGNKNNSFFTDATNIISLTKADKLYESEIWLIDKSIPKIKTQTKTKSVRQIKKDRYIDNIINKNNPDLKSIILLLNNDNNFNSDLFLRYFELHPSQIKEIKNLLKNNNFSPKLISNIFLMLGKLGNKEAQKLLIDIWEDKDFSKNERINAIASLLSLKNKPIDGLFEKLISGLERIKTDEKDSDLFSTPILISGIIIKNIKENYPQIATDYNDRLITLLESTEEPAQINTLLLSLGNSRIETNIDVIVDYINYEDERVLDTAIFVAGKYSSPEITDVLMSKLNNPINSSLKSNILRSLYNQPMNKNQIEQIENILLTSQDVSVRSYAIKILSKNKDLDYDKINKTLKTAYKKETSKDNLKLLINAFEK